MTITKTCNTCEHYPNDKHCIGCEWDKSKGENNKWELKENPIVIERAVLDKIRAEIETKYGQCDICEYFEDYEENDISEYRPIGDIADILQIIDKYKAESNK